MAVSTFERALADTGADVSVTTRRRNRGLERHWAGSTRRRNRGLTIRGHCRDRGLERHWRRSTSNLLDTARFSSLGGHSLVKASYKSADWGRDGLIDSVRQSLFIGGSPFRGSSALRVSGSPKDTLIERVCLGIPFIPVAALLEFGEPGRL